MDRARASLDDLRSIAGEFGIEHLGVAPAEVMTRARAALLQRRERGLADTMQFTYRNPERSTDPSRVVPGARSIIVAARSCVVGDDESETTEASGVPSGRVARYARFDHYAELRAALAAIAGRLELDGERSVVCVDDNALVDREAAYLAGLGWFGKNANLLIPGAGSHFVLGGLVTTADYLDAVVPPVADGCGACRRCVDACPTGAIIEAGVVDARRCLAWLVQRPGVFPMEFRAALGDRIYGCDDCQTVCPPTIRGASTVTVESARASVPGAVSTAGTTTGHRGTWVDLVEALTSSDEWLLARFGRWYIPGRDARWIRRNAVVVLGNTAEPLDARARSILDRFAAGDDELLAEHATWALRRLDERAGTIAGSSV